MNFINFGCKLLATTLLFSTITGCATNNKSQSQKYIHAATLSSAVAINQEVLDYVTQQKQL